MPSDSERIVPVRLSTSEWARMIGIISAITIVQVWGAATFVTELRADTRAAYDAAAGAMIEAKSAKAEIKSTKEEWNTVLRKIAEDVGELKGLVKSQSTRTK